MNKTAKKLLAVLDELDSSEQSNILSFAEFLLDKAKKEGRITGVATEPLDIPRPTEERVVAAIKRLSETYPMIQKNAMLDQTASLMSAHILQGRAASDVIDELEVLFKEHYLKKKNLEK